MFTKFKKKKQFSQFFNPEEVIPKHVAIIMDGNGRWAKKHNLPRIIGHREGMKTVKKITKAANALGIRVLTLYVFSTENWKRPSDEINFLMKLPVDFFDSFVPDLIKENVQVRVMGYVEELPRHTQEAIEKAIERTAKNTGLILNFALNYGGRSEIVEAVQRIAEQVQEQKFDVADIDEMIIGNQLMTNVLPREWREPELLIRTSGEKRLSNFLLWQVAYSEFYFTDEFWPDFTGESLKQALASFQKRNRRFGGLSS